MDRCNLTILMVPRFRDLPEFLAEHRVEVIASLPYYLARNTDAQRGAGVFDDSIAAIRRLNELGYGVEGTGLELNLVYNPTGAFLPPKQAGIEPDFRRELDRGGTGWTFNRLFVITNMPINRFLEFLLRTGQYEAYMAGWSPPTTRGAAEGVMCRTTFSVGWDGSPVRLRLQPAARTAGRGPDSPRHLAEFDAEALARPDDRHGAALLRLHRGGGVELRRRGRPLIAVPAGSAAGSDGFWPSTWPEEYATLSGEAITPGIGAGAVGAEPRPRHDARRGDRR